MKLGKCWEIGFGVGVLENVLGLSTVVGGRCEVVEWQVVCGICELGRCLCVYATVTHAQSTRAY